MIAHHSDANVAPPSAVVRGGHLVWKEPELNSSHYATPEIILVGWRTEDGHYAVMSSEKLVKASVDVVQHDDDEEITMGNSIVATLPSSAHFTFKADTVSTEPGGSDILWIIAGDSYAHAIRLLGGMMPSLQDHITHAKVANAIADALEVDDDDLVNKIAEAVMETGEFPE